MKDASPARLYATLVGCVLTILGIAGFFYSSSFGRPGTTGELLGLFEVNGWYNVVHILTGAIGLFVAGYAARRYALWMGALYLAFAIWGIVLGNGESILGFLPVTTENNFLNLALGGLGVCAAFATPRLSAKREGPPVRNPPARGQTRGQDGLRKPPDLLDSAG